MNPLLDTVTVVALGVLTLNTLLCLTRVALGPSAFDRVLGLECITYNLSGAVVLMSLRLGTGVFMVFLLVIALLGFLGTVVLTAYLERTLGR